MSNFVVRKSLKNENSCVLIKIIVNLFNRFLSIYILFNIDYSKINPKNNEFCKKHIKEIKTEKLILTDRLEIIIIELKKIKGKERVEGQLLDWLFFLDSPNSERVKEKMKKNKELKEANEKLQTMSEEEYMERMAWFREKAILDYNSGMSSALKRGRQEAKLEDAKKMLKEGINIKTIIRITELTEEEISNL